MQAGTGWLVVGVCRCNLAQTVYFVVVEVEEAVFALEPRIHVGHEFVWVRTTLLIFNKWYFLPPLEVE